METGRTIPVYGKFRLPLALNILQRMENPSTVLHEQVHFHFSLEVPGGAVEVWVRQDQADGDLQVRVLGDLGDEYSADTVVSCLRRMFSLTVDPTRFFQQVETDENLQSLYSLYPDLRPVQYLTPFEAAVRILIQRNFPLAEAATLISNLREACGVVPQGKSHAPPAFPGKFTLLAVPDRLLAVLGFPQNKIRIIKRFSEALVGDPDVLEHLLDVPSPLKARRKLEELPGISRRLAENLLLRAYGFQDLLTTDPQLVQAVKHFYQLPRLPHVKTLARIAEPYIPWRSWWMFLLQAGTQIKAVN